MAAAARSKPSRATKKLNGAKPKDAIKLTADDKRWYENLMLKQELVKRESESKIMKLVEDEKEMFASIKKRTGIEVTNWSFDWNGLMATPKAKPEPKAKPGPKPKQTKQAEPPQPQAD